MLRGVCCCCCCRPCLFLPHMAGCGFFGALWTVLLNHVAELLGRSSAVSSRTCFGLPRGYVLSLTPGRLWFCHLIVRQTIASRTQDFKVFLKNRLKSNLSESNRKSCCWVDPNYCHSLLVSMDSVLMFPFPTVFHLLHLCTVVELQLLGPNDQHV